MVYFLATLFLIFSILLILVVLLQKGRGGGLGAAFGGMGSTAFGTRIGDVFTWVTIVLAMLFLVLAVLASVWWRTEPGECRAPQFDPAPGPIEKETRVAILSPTDGCTIHFTKDGTDPTAESPVYEKPLLMQPGDTVKAVATRPGWKMSPVAEGYYPQAQPATGPASLPALEPPAVPAGPTSAPGE